MTTDSDQKARDRLLEERWRLENSFGYGPVHDGAVRDRIAEIDRLLTQY